MIAESLTPQPGIREQNRHKADILAALNSLFISTREERSPLLILKIGN
jgi:hypothetical protein